MLKNFYSVLYYPLSLSIQFIDIFNRTSTVAFTRELPSTAQQSARELPFECSTTSSVAFTRELPLSAQYSARELPFECSKSIEL